MTCTMVTPYYEDAPQLIRHLSQGCLEQLDEIIIVDDCSPSEPAMDIVSDFKHLPISVYWVTEDLGFNGHGCRNLGVSQAETEWVFLSDVDQVISPTAMNQMLTKMRSAPMNTFVGATAGGLPAYNTYAIRREDYMMSGGYDEEFVNIHGGSRCFVDRLHTFLSIEYIDEEIPPSRKGRDLRAVEGQEYTEYDDFFIYHPKHTWDRVDELLEMAARRTANPESWLEKTFVNFDWKKLQ